MALGKSFNNYVDQHLNGTALRQGYQILSAGGTVCDNGAAADGITTIGNVAIPHVAAVGGGATGRIITKITLNIKKIAATVPANPVDFSQLDFFLEQQDNGGNLKKRWFFTKGILKGLNDFDGTGGTETRRQLLFDFGPNVDISADNCVDTKLYDAFVASGSTNKFTMIPTSFDPMGVIGQRADDPTPAQQYNYVLKVKNNTYTTNAAQGRSITLGAGDIELNVITLSLNALPLALEPQTVATQGVDYLFPQFKWDSSSQKVFLSRNNIYDNWFGLQIFMNDNLRRLLSFEQYKVLDVSDSTTHSKFFDNANFTDLDKGAFYKFPLFIDKLNANTDVNGREYDEFDEFYEHNSTVFARDWLDAIVITSASIATQGEIVGNGNSARKTLTDFKLDPSTIKRDYLIYQPDGAIRYYPLRSTEALRDIQISAFFQDIYGKLREMKVPPSQTASIKLEFRPNNMISNY